MILYNITAKIDWSIHDDWLRWMKEVHIPGMLDNDIFFDHRMFRLLEVDDVDGPTYAVQYFSDSICKYNLFVEKQLFNVCQIEANKWGNKLLSFSTIMQLVQ